MSSGSSKMSVKERIRALNIHNESIVAEEEEQQDTSATPSATPVAAAATSSLQLLQTKSSQLSTNSSEKVHLLKAAKVNDVDESSVVVDSLSSNLTHTPHSFLFPFMQS